MCSAFFKGTPTKRLDLLAGSSMNIEAKSTNLPRINFMTGSILSSVQSSILLTITLALMACSKADRGQPVVPIDRVKGLAHDADAKLLVLNADQQLISDAKNAGLEVTGTTIVEIKGKVATLAKLKTASSAVEAILDERVVVENRSESNPGSFEKLDQETMYLAKDEFGLIEWLNSRPHSDGRGVVVGVMDDGIAPDLSGLGLTSTGERKVIALGKSKSALDTAVELFSADRFPEAFYSQIAVGEGDILYGATIQEKTAFNTASFLDLNGNGSRDLIPVAVVVKEGRARVCVDANINQKTDDFECFGTFAATNEYGYWDAKRLRAVWAEFDQTALTLAISAGEFANKTGDVDYDSHGEGVATVMAGHKVGGRNGRAFDGIAPGAKVVSYDLSEPSVDGVDSLYTTATFLRGYEWLGQQGAQVINTSYSFFFHSAETQAFFNKAVAALVQKYGYVMSFSAGNNGPGLGSFNRGLMYPDSALVAGAYVSKKLDEYVHGVTGLPEEGRVVFYSSRGPAPDGGRAPTVISPLASLTHSTVGEGYQAFNGTSSASPALAGLAAVLISAIKQDGLAFDAFALAQAIRQSGRRLPRIPFIDQGYGLPEVTKAFETYKQIVLNQRFPVVATKTNTGAGIFLRASQLSKDIELPVKISGKAAPIQDRSSVNRLLIPTTFSSNVKWLNHPTNGWVSTGESSAYVSLKKAAVLKALDRSTMGELTGEIEVRSSDSGELLAVFPVTVVDDREIVEDKEVNVSVGAEEGKRIHFGVAEGTGAVEISVDEVSSEGVIAMMSYDGYSIRGARVPLRSRRTYVVALARSGWNQLAFVRWGGTKMDTTAKLTIRPIRLSLANKVTSRAKPIAMFKNLGSELNGILAALPRRQTFFESVKISSLDAVQVWELPVPAVGSLWSSASSRSFSNISYISSQCLQWLETAAGVIVASIPTDGSQFEITEEHLKQATSMQLRCASFEYGSSPTGDTQVEWNVDMKHYPKQADGRTWSSMASLTPVRLPQGMSSFPLATGIDDDVELFYRAGVDGGELKLGVLSKLAE